MTRIIPYIIAILMFTTSAFAGHEFLEKDYQKKWCNEAGGAIEHILPDKTRVDCLTDEYAIEFDFAYKHFEAIGQALYYGIMTNRKPGIVLILERPAKDQRYLNRLLGVAHKYDIRVWVMNPEDLR